MHVQDHLIVAEWPGQLGADGEIVQVPTRTTVNIDGDAISEWHTSVEAIEAFLARSG